MESKPTTSSFPILQHTRVYSRCWTNLPPFPTPQYPVRVDGEEGGGEEGTSLERLSQRHKERVQGPVAWNTSTAYEPATLTSWSFLNKSAAKLLRSVAMVRFSLPSNGAAKNITRSKCIFLCIPGTELKKKKVHWHCDGIHRAVTFALHDNILCFYFSLLSFSVFFFQVWAFKH